MLSWGGCHGQKGYILTDTTFLASCSQCHTFLPCPNSKVKYFFKEVGHSSSKIIVLLFLGHPLPHLMFKKLLTLLTWKQNMVQTSKYLKITVQCLFPSFLFLLPFLLPFLPSLPLPPSLSPVSRSMKVRSGKPLLHGITVRAKR